MSDDGSRVFKVSLYPPGIQRAKRRQLFITPATGLQEVIALTQSIAWVQTHWDPEARTVRPHFAEGKCDLCNVTKPVWIGFLAAYMEKRRLCGLLPIPWEAWVNSDSLQRENGKLRGRVIAASRKREAKNGPVRMAVMSKEFDGKVPDAFDVSEALCRHFDIAPQDLFEEGDEDTRVSLAGEQK